ncbi:hypothetical protein SH528x_002244 [Novipirellula sp. SH528]|uniref:hypothetical protein n=1 Tax=Novipirellula sp. SH528 TaxID=3454466 RepID=UPI003F9F9DBC
MPTSMPTAPTTCSHRRLDLQPTIDLHDWLCQKATTDRVCIDQLAHKIRQAVHQRSIWFERQRELPLALSAVVLRPADVSLLQSLSETLHILIEQAIDWTLAEPERLVRYFPDHSRFAPFLARTPGLDSWQGYSRYDAVVTATGEVKFIEVNTCCPAGFLHAPDASEIVLSALSQLDLPLSTSKLEIGTLERDVLVDELLRIEQQGGGNPEHAVALLNDENGLSNEVEMLKAAFVARGREVIVASAEDIRRQGSSVTIHNRPISLTWNKIRVSTPNSPNHCWKAGFERRYKDFLEGLRDQAMVSVNNLVAATIAEDKGLLALFYDPEFRSELDDTQRQFIDDHLLWTSRLQPGETKFHGKTIDLLPYVRKHRNQFVIKPANEGRGFGVHIGEFCDDEQWAIACQPNPDLPGIVQEYVKPLTLPILSSPGGANGILQSGSDASGSKVSGNGQTATPPLVALSPQSMQMTLAMGVICGRYHGLFSRVAAGPVTNVGKAGMLQAVFVNGSSER